MSELDEHEKLGLQIGALVGYEMMNTCERLHRLFKLIPQLARAMNLKENLIEDLDDLVSTVPLANIKGAESKCRSALKKINAEFKAQNMETSIFEIRRCILGESRDEIVKEIMLREDILNAKTNPGQTSSKPVSKKMKKKSNESKNKNSQDSSLEKETAFQNNTEDHQLKKTRNKKRKRSFEENTLKNSSSNSIPETAKLEPPVITSEQGTKALNSKKLSGKQKQKKRSKENCLKNSSLNGITEISKLESFDIKVDDFMASSDDSHIDKQVHTYESKEQNASGISKDKINHDQEPESNCNSKKIYEYQDNKENEIQDIGNTAGGKLSFGNIAASNNEITVSGYSAKRNFCQDEDNIGNSEEGILYASLTPSVPMHPDIILDEGSDEPIIEEILGNIGGYSIINDIPEQQENNEGDHKDTVGDNEDAAIIFEDGSASNEVATIPFEDAITFEDAAITFEDGSSSNENGPITNEDVAISFGDGPVVDIDDAAIGYEDGPVADEDDAVPVEDNPGAYVPGTYEDSALSTIPPWKTVELITID